MNGFRVFWLMGFVFSGTLAAASPATEAPPSAEMLLYLSDLFVDVEGTWVDPIALQESKEGSEVKRLKVRRSISNDSSLSDKAENSLSQEK